MASLRLSTALRSSAYRFHNYTVVTHPVMPRRIPAKIPTLSFRKANASTTATTSEDMEKNITNGPSSSDSIESGNHLGNGNGESNGVSNENRNGIGELPTDWSKSYHGLSSVAFSKEIVDVLQAPIDPLHIEMKPGELFVTHRD